MNDSKKRIMNHEADNKKSSIQILNLQMQTKWDEAVHMSEVPQNNWFTLESSLWLLFWEVSKFGSKAIIILSKFKFKLMDLTFLLTKNQTLKQSYKGNIALKILY